ncbi:MAG: hypothetical protein D6721_00580, partial [Gammaproteobacteria bacterium]
MPKIRRYLCPEWFLAGALLVLASGPVAAAPGDHHRLTRGAVLHARPAAEGRRAGTLPRGREVVEIQRTGRWVLVFDPRSRRQGWVSARLLEAKTVPARSPKAPPALPEHGVTLRALGWRDGIRLEGSGLVHERRFVFQVPRDTPITDLRLELHYLSSPRLLELAWMRVEVGDRLVREIRLPR